MRRKVSSRPIYAPTVEVTSKDDRGGEVRAISPAQDIVQ